MNLSLEIRIIIDDEHINISYYNNQVMNLI